MSASPESRRQCARAVAAAAATLLLAGCSIFDVEDVAPAAAPVAGCQQQAEALGFRVLAVEPAQPGPYGSVTPVLVQWGDSGGVHLFCRSNPDGSVTLG